MANGNSASLLKTYLTTLDNLLMNLVFLAPTKKANLSWNQHLSANSKMAIGANIPKLQSGV